jgi:hypothetical protein
MTVVMTRQVHLGIARSDSKIFRKMWRFTRQLESRRMVGFQGWLDRLRVRWMALKRDYFVPFKVLNITANRRIFDFLVSFFTYRKL